MTCDHVFIFKGVKKAKILLSQCWIMFFLLASSQVASLAICTNTTNLHVSPAAKTPSHRMLTFVLQRLHRQQREKPHSQLRVCLGCSFPEWSLLPDPTSCKFYLSIENLNLPPEVYDHRRQKFEQTWSKIFACIGQEQGIWKHWLTVASCGDLGTSENSNNTL